MEGMLSQDEINALLSGMDLSDSGNGAADNNTGSDELLLTDEEKDAIGEVANISMGSSATTLYSLVNRKVNITTPVVTLAKWDSVLAEHIKPCVFIQIKYTSGLDGSNILVLKESDVKIITDLMMGGDGTNTEGELGELHLSAISEAMNQMMGSAATSLSTMLNKVIDISPPDSSLVDLSKFETGEEIAPFLSGTFVKISFKMQIGDLVDSTIMQLYPIDFAKDLVATFLKQETEYVPEAANEEPAPEIPIPQPMPQPAPAAPVPENHTMPQGGYGMPQPGYTMPQGGYGMPQPGYTMPQGGYQVPPVQPNVNIQPAQFQNFTNDFTSLQSKENIDLIMDVPLEVTVELGRTNKSIADILDFAPGTIIELDRIAGEPIDVLVNGKFVAKGEVVVIEESFGVRVTEIIK